MWTYLFAKWKSNISWKKLIQPLPNYRFYITSYILKYIFRTQKKNQVIHSEYVCCKKKKSLIFFLLFLHSIPPFCKSFVTLLEENIFHRYLYENMTTIFSDVRRKKKNSYGKWFGEGMLLFASFLLSDMSNEKII